MGSLLNWLGAIGGFGLFVLGVFELFARRGQKREARLRALEDWQQHAEDQLRLLLGGYRTFTK